MSAVLLFAFAAQCVISTSQAQEITFFVLQTYNGYSYEFVDSQRQRLKETYSNPYTGISIWRSEKDSQLDIENTSKGTKGVIYFSSAASGRAKRLLAGEKIKLTVESPESIYVGSISTDRPILYIFDLHPDWQNGSVSLKYDYTTAETAVLDLSDIISTQRVFFLNPGPLIDTLYRFSKARNAHPMIDEAITIVVLTKDTQGALVIDFVYKELSIGIERQEVALGHGMESALMIEMGRILVQSHRDDLKLFNIRLSTEFQETNIDNEFLIAVNFSPEEVFLAYIDRVDKETNDVARFLILKGVKPISFYRLYSTIQKAVNPFAHYNSFANLLANTVPIKRHITL